MWCDGILIIYHQCLSDWWWQTHC